MGPSGPSCKTKKNCPWFSYFSKGSFLLKTFLAEKKNKTDQAYSLGLKMTIVLLQKNNFDELYGKYINICGTKLVSLDRYLNIVFNEFI
jgi:hypothetical protein